MPVTASWSKRPGKRRLLVLLPLFLTSAVVWTIVFPWLRRVDLEDPAFARFAHLNAVIWVLILWWSFHHLSFQVAALLKLAAPLDPDTPAGNVSFAIFYLTCDDFDAAACASCLAQDTAVQERRRVGLELGLSH